MRCTSRGSENDAGRKFCVGGLRATAWHERLGRVAPDIRAEAVP